MKEASNWKSLEVNRNGTKDYRLKLLSKHFVNYGISSIGSNGAIVHYAPSPTNSRMINNREIYLLDSGGQYLDGTTDITRTVHYGIPTKEEKEMYTRVLKGNIDLERLIIPKSREATGVELDFVARRHLFEVGYYYGHATGHGVGHFGLCHEGPASVDKGETYVYKPGMVLSNEPGYYKEDAYGIRIENLLLTVDKLDASFWGFLNLTMVPYETKLIKVELLSRLDIDFINTYHKEVYEKLAPLLLEQNNEKAVDWLKLKTEPIKR